MAEQNINQYVYKKYNIGLVSDGMDMSLASDEREYKEEVVFSPYLIAQTYGDKLPIYYDIDNPLTVQNIDLFYKNYNYTNVFVSQNFYNPDNKDLSCFTGSSSCDIGFTGIDNGLVSKIADQTIYFTNGLFDDSVKFNRMYFDRRMKMFQVTGYTNDLNRFEAFPKKTLYEVVSKIGSEGRYHELYGGFYQGFYKLFGYEYEVFPERVNKGWSVEMIIKPRFVDEYPLLPNETNLNEIYPKNKNTFFYMGARAENKFYHYADGTPNCFPSYNRVTTPLANCLQTCACCNQAVTNSRCLYLYPPRPADGSHDPHKNYGCNVCGNVATITTPCGCDCNQLPCENCGWECKGHTCPIKTLVFQICNSNGAIDDDFNVYLNNTFIGQLNFSSNTKTNVIFVGSTNTNVNFTEYDFFCENQNTTVINFNPSIVIEGENTIFLQNIKNNNNGNYGAIDIKNYLLLGNSLFNPKPITSTFYNGPSGSNFTIGFTSYLYPTPTPTPLPTVTPTPDCKTPTPTCTPTCTSCNDCDICETCKSSPLSSIENTCESDSLFDSMSNNIAFKLCGNPKNPSIGIKVLRLTGSCITSGTCVTGQTFVTGYTIQEWCTEPIYSYCEKINPAFLEQEHWFLVSVVWERYTNIETKNLDSLGGLGAISDCKNLESLANNTPALIAPPFTRTEAPQKIQLINLNYTWIDEEKYRKGRLKIYVNGKQIYTIEDFEEIIPRALSTDKEKQVGVPFNISWGGGTQGLHENLVPSACDKLSGDYIQDPESFPTSVLENSSLNGLKTDILLEQEFAGFFKGAISQFRMYVEPLDTSEIRHNFNLVKNKFKIFDPFCPDCDTFACPPNDFTYSVNDIISGTGLSDEIITDGNYQLGRNYIEDERDKKYLIKNHLSKIPSLLPPSKNPTQRFWDDNGWWGNQGSLPQCVGYAWAHWLEDGPIPQSGIPPIIKPSDIYFNAQKLDQWPGENYQGTSVRGGVKYLQNIKKVKNYYWAFDVQTLINTVMKIGPVVVGTNWYYNMFFPDRNGLIKATGRLMGGHAYVINGVDIKNKQFRIKNSWGKTWGQNGRAFISFNDMTRLIRENGEICLATEVGS